MNWASLQVSEWKKNNSTENEYITFVIFLSEDIVSGPRTGLNFFQVLFTTTRSSSVLSCEDLLISSFHRSANMWIFIYLKSKQFTVEPEIVFGDYLEKWQFLKFSVSLCGIYFLQVMALLQ